MVQNWVPCQRTMVLIAILMVLWMNTKCSAMSDTNWCQNVNGCTCSKDTADGSTQMYCARVTDPPLYLMPHNEVNRIQIRECEFRNVSLLGEIRKTKATKVGFFANTFPEHTQFNWDWIPDSAGNVSLSQNGFRHFESSNLKNSKCVPKRFRPNFTLFINSEYFESPTSCIPDSTSLLILKELLNVKMDEKQNFTWPRQLSYLKLADGGFEKIQDGMFQTSPASLKIIWIHNQNLEEGRWPAGLPARSLKQLLITNCGMREISSDEMAKFKTTNKLQQLGLGYNDLTEIPANLPSSLTSLRLHNNRIQHIDPQVWKSLNHLTTLDLHNNQLKSVPLSMPPTLRSLYLTHNHIEYSDPEAFGKLKNLTHLDLSENSLTAMPIGLPVGLKTYLLQSNQISLVQDPKEYTFCSECTVMWLHNNPWFCNIEMMKMLAWVSMHNVSISAHSDLNDGTPRCQERPVTGLTDNWLSLVVEYMEYYRTPPNDKCEYDIDSLKCLNAGLVEVPDTIPIGLGRINIDDNPNITTVPDYKFHSVTSLKRLIMDRNSLSHIPYGLPQQLIMLSLDGNKITDLTERDSTALKNLTLLKFLYLESNQITVLHSWQFEPLTNLAWIGLIGNKLHCDCNLLSFIIWFEKLVPRPKYLTDNNPQCYTPIEKRTQDILTLMGYIVYGLECSPSCCEWHPSSDILNCSAHQELYQGPQAPKIPTNSFWTTLDLSGLELTSNQIGYKHLTAIKDFILADNLLSTIPTDGLPPQTERLDLSNNQIQHLPSHEVMVRHLPTLKILDLRSNNIKNLDGNEVGILPLLDSVYLAGNPFVCNCSLRPLASWMHVNKDNMEMVQRYQLNSLKCHKYGEENTRSIMETEQHVYCSPPPVVTIISGCAAGLGLVLLIIVVVNVYLQRKRKKRERKEILLGFQDLLRKDVAATGADPETGVDTKQHFKFDAFVSYDCDSPDAEFVITLLEELEDRRGYKLCLNERDFMAGAGVIDNIVECIGASKRIILILSKHFVSSPWCQYEVQAALAELHQRRRSKFLIALLLEDISADDNLAESVKIFLSLVPGIHVPGYSTDSGDEYEWKDFWGKLTEAMPPQGKEQPINEAMALLNEQSV